VESQRIVAANELALSTGIKPGHSSSTARALIEDGELRLLNRDRNREAQVIEQLLCWAYGFTPTLEAWHGNTLQLEVGSCLKLYRDVNRLNDALKRKLAYRGFTVASGLAPNRWSAWLLSHTNSRSSTGDDVNRQAALTAIPLRILLSIPGNDFQQSVERLEKAGIKTLGQLLNLPPSSIARRCGKPLHQWLQALTTTSDRLATDFLPPQQFKDSFWFGFEIRHSNELQPAMEQLLEGLAGFLTSAQLTTTTINWHMLRAQGGFQSLTVKSSEAHRSVERWLKLSALQLEHYSLEENIEGLSLDVSELQQEVMTENDLFGDSRSNESLYSLIDRLRARLGLQAVQYLDLREAHLPEFSQLLTQEQPAAAPLKAYPGQRPFWLLEEPHPIRAWNDQLFWNGPLELIYGPERIEDNWWDQPTSRDYYVARTEEGQPIWIFQNRHNQRWYVQGVLP
jgi:protein ImuB